jgi:hypothetical protein
MSITNHYMPNTQHELRYIIFDTEKLERHKWPGFDQNPAESI